MPKLISLPAAAYEPPYYIKSLTEGPIENLISPQLDLHAQCRTTHYNMQQLSTREANLFQRLHCHDTR